MNDELQMRSFWRAWHAHMCGRPVPAMPEDRERAVTFDINLD